MTKQLQRYIARHIFHATLIVSCIIIGVLFVLTLLNELRNVGEGGYGVSDALFYVMMRLPGLAYQFSAFLILLGSIVGLSMLITHREIMAMRVSGFSMRHIIASTLSAAFLFALLLSVMGEWLAPKLNNIAEINKENSRNAGEALVTSHGVWLHIGDNFVHFSQVINHHLLEGVTRYQFDRHHRLVSVYYAKRLLFQNDAWHMQDAVKTTFTVNHAVSQAFQELDWDLQWNVGFLDHEERSPDEMSLKELS
ncbi:MAG: hypothetical protein ACD_45C00492G0001, partial [uncultured bacterium]